MHNSDKFEHDMWLMCQLSVVTARNKQFFFLHRLLHVNAQDIRDNDFI